MSCQSPWDLPCDHPSAKLYGGGSYWGRQKGGGAANTAIAVLGTAAEAQPLQGTRKEKWDSPGPVSSVFTRILLYINLGDRVEQLGGVAGDDVPLLGWPLSQHMDSKSERHS